MCYSGQCVYERGDGDCKLAGRGTLPCEEEYDFDELENRLYDEYTCGDVTLSQARSKYNRFKNYRIKIM